MWNVPLRASGFGSLKVLSLDPPFGIAMMGPCGGTSTVSNLTNFALVPPIPGPLFHVPNVYCVGNTIAINGSFVPLTEEFGGALSTTSIQNPFSFSDVGLMEGWISLVNNREWSRNKGNFWKAFENFIDTSSQNTLFEDWNIDPLDNNLLGAFEAHSHFNTYYDVFYSRKTISSLLDFFSATVIEREVLTLGEFREFVRTELRHQGRRRIRFDFRHLKTILAGAPSSSTRIKGFMLLTGVSPPEQVTDNQQNIGQQLNTQEKFHVHYRRPTNAAHRGAQRHRECSARRRSKGRPATRHLGCSYHVARRSYGWARAYPERKGLNTGQVFSACGWKLVDRF
jgi:hypothetical protein